MNKLPDKGIGPQIPSFLGPTQAAFFVSLLLSLIAGLDGTLNRDGMLYIDTAKIFLEEGFAAARTNFSWPFLPICIALFAKLTGLGLETAGFLMNALFMAGASAFLVSAASRTQPQAAWMTCLTVLALPGINEYRGELLREFGCWFFVMSAFWLAQRWSERPRWPVALAVQGLVGVAALFRPEALAMMPAIVAWQVFAAPAAERLRRLLMLGALPIACAAALTALYFGHHLSPADRLAGEISRFERLAAFGTKAEAMAATFPDFARDQARTILFFGSLAIVPIKFAGKIGVLLLPLIWALVAQRARSAVRAHALFGCGFIAHLLVLAVFVLDLQFLAGRYVGLLLLFSAPLAGFALWALTEGRRRWRGTVTAALTIVMLASTVSLGGSKTHFVEAGAWLAANASPTPRVFIGSGRAAYYAGWRYQDTRPDLRLLADDVRNDRYDLLVLEVSRRDTALQAWIENSRLTVLQRFADRRGDSVVVLAAGAASKDERKMKP